MLYVQRKRRASGAAMNNMIAYVKNDNKRGRRVARIILDKFQCMKMSCKCMCGCNKSVQVKYLAQCEQCGKDVCPMCWTTMCDSVCHDKCEASRYSMYASA